jgi:hypothetical protein
MEYADVVQAAHIHVGKPQQITYQNGGKNNLLLLSDLKFQDSHISGRSGSPSDFTKHLNIPKSADKEALGQCIA